MGVSFVLYFQIFFIMLTYDFHDQKKRLCKEGGILTLPRECGGEGVALCTGTQCLLVSCVFPSQEVLRSKIRNLPLTVGVGGGECCHLTVDPQWDLSGRPRPEFPAHSAGCPPPPPVISLENGAQGPAIIFSPLPPGMSLNEDQHLRALRRVYS